MANYTEQAEMPDFFLNKAQALWCRRFPINGIIYELQSKSRT